MGYVFAILFLWVLPPVAFCADIARKRHRNIRKAEVVGLLFGWFGVLFLWLALGRRETRADGSSYIA